MLLLKLDNVSLEFLDKVIFDSINFVFNQGDKIGVVGDNGSGKTSLFNIILKNAQFSGSVILNSNNYGYLSQDDIFIDLALSSLRKKEIEKLLIQDKIISDIDGYNKLLEEYNSLINNDVFDGEDGLIEGFNFQKDLYFKEKQDELSGGENTKLRLIKLFMKEYDFYLFDEPTNHLDLTSKEFLIQKLLKLQSFIVISHDVELLNRTCNKIVEIRDSKLYVYSGNYDNYVNEKKKEKEKVLKIQEIHDKRRKKIENEIDKLENRVKASQIKARKVMLKSGGILKSDDKETYHANKSKMEKFEDIKSKTIKKRSKELDDLNTPEQEMVSTIKIKYFDFEEPNSIVIKINNLLIEFENFKLHVENLEVSKNDKIALLGDNGSGKSTLLKTIFGLNRKYSPELVLGSKVKIGYLDQKNQDFNFENSLLEEIRSINDFLEESVLRKFLGKFLFKKDDVFKKVKDLSGGERIRLGLLKVILQGANFLVLDEPSNHLDIKSKDVLAEALKEFLGPVLVVSHDKYFIDKFVNRKIYITEGELKNLED